MLPNDKIVVNWLILAIRMFLLTFAMRHVGFSANQTLVLSVSIAMCFEIK